MPPSSAPGSLPDKLLANFRVAQALNALSSLHPAAERRLRSLGYSGFFLNLSGLLSVFLVDRLGVGDATDIIALRILAYACWLYGMGVLWTLLKPGAFEGTALAPLRGMDLPLSIPVFFTLTVRLGRGASWAGLPSVALAAFMAPDQATQKLRLVQLALCIPYLCTFAVGLALVGSLSIVWTPHRARFTALAILVIPFLLELAGLPLPNLISGLVWGMGKLIVWGGQ